MERQKRIHPHAIHIINCEDPKLDFRYTLINNGYPNPNMDTHNSIMDNPLIQSWMSIIHNHAYL